MVTNAGGSVSLDSGDVVIDADTLAEWLGVDTATLSQAIENDTIRTLVERGEGEDAGRVRLTVRYQNRQLCMIREPDGSLTETTPPPETRRYVKPSLMQLLDR
ncbi:DUF6522 family protein [Halomonadaceae bacterium KBTZ08]